MELSKEILSFLHWLNMRGLPFEAAFLKDMIPGPDEIDEQQLRENVKAYLLINKIVSKYKKAKSEPIFESIDAIEKLLAELSEISDEDLINTYLTEECLAKIPQYVHRLKELIAARVAKVPGSKVKNYFKQAANCYIFGLYDAVATLSRSVLEFAIEEALKEKNQNVLAVPLENKKGYLERLIEVAEHTRTIPKAYVGMAHNIRKIGNKAIHQNATVEATACQVIKETAIILSKIYEGR